MIKHLIIIVGLCSLVLLSTFSYSTTYAAFDVSGGACSGAAADSAACDPSINGKDPLTGNEGVLSKVANIVTLVAGAAAVIVIIVGAIRYITSGGDANAITSGKKMIVGALIGLAIISLARTMIYYLVHHINK